MSGSAEQIAPVKSPAVTRPLAAASVTRRCPIENGGRLLAVLREHRANHARVIEERQPGIGDSDHGEPGMAAVNRRNEQDGLAYQAGERSDPATAIGA